MIYPEPEDRYDISIFNSNFKELEDKTSEIFDIADNTAVNIMPLPYTNADGEITAEFTVNGLTVTPLSAGGLHITGTSAGNTDFHICESLALSAGTAYTLSGCPQITGTAVRITANDAEIMNSNHENIAVYTPESNVSAVVHISIADGTAIDDYFYPMLEADVLKSHNYSRYICSGNNLHEILHSIVQRIEALESGGQNE